MVGQEVWSEVLPSSRVAGLSGWRLVDGKIKGAILPEARSRSASHPCADEHRTFKDLVRLHEPTSANGNLGERALPTNPRSLVPSGPPALPSEPLLTGLGHLGRGLPLGRRKGLGGERIRVVGRFHFRGELGEHRLHAFGLLGQGREILGLIGI